MKTSKSSVLPRVIFSVALLLSGCAGLNGGVPIEDIQNKANQGDANAQFQLGLAYDQGTGVAKNQSEAAAWYRKAAEQGHAAAQNSLGSMYQYGEGVSQDNAKAVSWYEKSANQGYSEAYTNLGYMFDEGLGVTQDKQKAVGFYERGAEKGSLTAMLNLGVSYWEDKGLAKDLVQAYKWLDLARFYSQGSRNMKLKWRIREVLDEVKKEMTNEQIDAADKLSRQWDAVHRSKWPAGN